MSLVSILEKNLLPCYWKKLGLECLGCGMQRSVIHMLRGEFAEAFFQYPAIYSLLAMGAFLLLHLKYQFAKGHKVLLWLFMFNLFLILGNYIWKTL